MYGDITTIDDIYRKIPLKSLVEVISFELTLLKIVFLGTKHNVIKFLIWQTLTYLNEITEFFRIKPQKKLTGNYVQYGDPSLHFTKNKFK